MLWSLGCVSSLLSLPRYRELIGRSSESPYMRYSKRQDDPIISLTGNVVVCPPTQQLDDMD